MRRFLDRLRPAVARDARDGDLADAVLRAAERGMPIVLGERAACRSARSRRYRRFGALGRRLLSNGVTVCAQTAADAERFDPVGAARRARDVTGNVKFDLQIPAAAVEAGPGIAMTGAALRDLSGSRAARAKVRSSPPSTAHREVQRRHPHALLVLVPRHPPRFEQVRGTAAQARRALLRAQRTALATGDDEILLVDTLGELQTLYAASDVAFVGGSLVPVGGHNLLEPASLGLPSWPARICRTRSRCATCCARRTRSRSCATRASWRLP